jgi:hypothetical protein
MCVSMPVPAIGRSDRTRSAIKRLWCYLVASIFLL